ncbi:MAG: hypothetical protein JWN40_4819 [Phycisphaerales bacterium]|nr:hypothetical protein [Phycisphaerales bacterium]
MSRTETTGRGPLTAIAIFKLIKATLLVVVAVGAQRLLHSDIQATIIHWARAVRVDPDDYILQAILTRVARVNPQQIKAISLGLFLYAGLFATEGVGLLLKKRWAEYLTVISTALLLPLEIMEVVRHPHVGRVVVLIANALIVVYLIVQLRRTRRRRLES